MQGQQDWQIEVEDNETVEGLKAKVSDKSGIAVDKMRLLCKLKVLEDGKKTLTDYKIADGATVFLVKI